MTFDAAIDLARDVPKKLKGARVLAIGTFLPVDELRPDSPWRVSVIVPGFARPTVLSSERDLESLLPTLPKPAPIAETRQLAREDTPMLF